MGGQKHIKKSFSITGNVRDRRVQLNTKIAIIGSSGSGKSSIITTFLEHKNVLSHKSPVQGFTNVLFQDSDNIFALDILDHSSSCKHNALEYPGIGTCDIFILVFTVGDMDSFEEVVKLRYKLMHLRRNGRQPVVGIIGNKSDILSNHTDNVMTELIVTCDWGHLYFETSVVRPETIHECLKQLIKVHVKKSGHIRSSGILITNSRRSTCPTSYFNASKQNCLKLLRKM